MSIRYWSTAGIISDESRPIQTYALSNLKWWERDGLTTYIDSLKYEEFKIDEEKWLRNHKVMNFDLIHVECTGSELSMSEKEYKTVWENDFTNYPEKVKKDTTSNIRRVEKDDLYLEKSIAIKFWAVLYIF